MTPFCGCAHYDHQMIHEMKKEINRIHKCESNEEKKKYKHKNKLNEIKKNLEKKNNQLAVKTPSSKRNFVKYK